MSDNENQNINKQVVLVTGATGMIGRELVHTLISQGYSIHAIVRDQKKAEQMFQDNSIVFHTIDMTDAQAVRALYQSVQPTKIFHLAASLMAWGVTEGVKVLVETNMLATVVMMEALEVIPETSFVYVDSFAIVGGQPEPIREDHLINPQEFYSISKLVGTLEGQQLARNKKYNIVIGRIFTAYGPGVPKGKLVEQVLGRSFRNEPITLTHPEVSRDFVYISDIATCLIELGEKADKYRGEIFNIGSGVATTIGELVEITKSLTKSTSTVEWHPERRTAYEMFPWQADMTKTFAHLSWRPKVSVREGIERTLEWLKTQQ